MERKYLLTALGYLLLGLLLGIHMAMSKNHSQLVTHAHIMLVGFVVSFIYAVCLKLWCANSEYKFRTAQFFIHQIGTLILVVGLFLLYGGFMPEPKIGPILGVGSILVLIGAISMKIDVIKSTK